MTPEAVEKYYNRCHPGEPLEPGDDRFVELDEFNDNENWARGEVWIESLTEEFRLTTRPVCKLFTGLKGTGKSTLLRALAHELCRDDAPKRLLKVFVDADAYFDLTTEIDAPELLAVVAYEIERAVLRAEGADPDKALTDGAIRRLWNYLEGTSVLPKEVEVGSGVGIGSDDVGKISADAKLKLELKTNPVIRQQLRSKVKATFGNFLAEVRAQVRSLYARARAAGFHGIFVVVDSLEKLEGIQANYTDVLTSAERLFANGAPYLQLVDDFAPGIQPTLVHVLYTVPPALVTQARVEDLTFLPMIKLHDRHSGDRWAPGFKAARELIRKRAPDAILNDVFGPTNLEARCEEIIRWSGGFPRGIVRLLQRFIARGRTVDEAYFRRTLNSEGDDYRRTIHVDDASLLAQVAVDHNLPIRSDEGSHAAVMRLLSNGVILRYRNAVEWFDLHPAVREMDVVRREVDRVTKARSQA